MFLGGGSIEINNPETGVDDLGGGRQHESTVVGRDAERN